jgi:hypothetical protein
VDAPFGPPFDIIGAIVSQVSSSHPKALRRPPLSYWGCKRRIQILRRYQDLVRHRERQPPDIQFAEPLENLIGPFKNAIERMHFLDQEIARLSLPVHHILNELGISTVVTRGIGKPQVGDAGIDHPQEEEKYDIVGNYLDGRVGSLEGQYSFDLLMRMVEEGIGVYQLRQEMAFRELFYPTVWLAYLVRLPLNVFERAGLVPEDKTVVDIYAKILILVTAVLLALIALKFGIQIPWKEILPFLK